ncbi:MAG: metallophosphoesterase family protein [Planctomycetes bacterium]|nr:metallophosphoesterase family protein [Planctomycetota bacterium]
MKRLNNHRAALLIAGLVVSLAVLVGALTAPPGLGAADRNPDGSYTGTKLEGTTPAQWRLIWEEDPAHTATVAWTTAKQPEKSTLLYDSEARQGDLAKYRFQVDATVGQYTDDEIHTWYNHAELSNLKPATTYWFVMVSDNTASREFHFITAPEGDAEFKLLYGGDSRSDRDARRTMNRRMRTLFEEDPEILALAHGGDYVANGEEMEDWDEWLTDHELTVTAEGRMLPVIPARGNHEAEGPLYDEVFNTPGKKDGNFYRTLIGEQFLLVTLNSNISAGGNQADFLETVLHENEQVRWQIANYHRPAYPAVKSPGSALEHWVPLFEKYNLDIAFESDGHALKRTCAIRGGKQADDGVVYIGEGGLGVKQRTPKDDRWYFKGGVAASTLHVQKLTVKKDSLLVESITDEGKVRDSYTAKPRKR